MHIPLTSVFIFQVIYALNTRNDEHEIIIQNVKEQHEEEVQRLITETKNKIEYYKKQIGSELDHKRKVESLQESLLAHEKQKTDAVVQFQTYKKEAEDKETQMKTEHSQKILDLSQEVLHAKKEFEAKLFTLENMRDRIEREKEDALWKLKEEMQLELEKVRNEQSSKHSDLTSEKEKLEEKYREEITKLSQKCQELDTEKTQLSEDYELKLNKAQAFFEKELAAMKDSQNTGIEEQMRILKEEQEKMQKDFAFQDSQNKKRIEDLLSQLSESEEEVEKYRSQMEQIQNSLQHKDSNSALLNQQVSKNSQNIIFGATGRYILSRTFNNQLHIFSSSVQHNFNCYKSNYFYLFLNKLVFISFW